MITYVELTEDRKLLGACMSRFCAEQGLPMMDAIMQVDAAHHACSGDHPTADAVLAAAGAAFTLEDVQSSHDRTTKALDASAGTPRPAGEVDAAGRVTMSSSDAERLIGDDAFATAQWREACELGLSPGDRDDWVRDARLFAAARCDLLASTQLERHDAEVAVALARDERRAPAAKPEEPRSRWDEAHGDTLRMLKAAVRERQESQATTTDDEVRALAVKTGKTTGPPGSRTDPMGRPTLSDAAAANIIVSDEAVVARWLRARRAGLPGSGSQPQWVAHDRSFAANGLDYLGWLEAQRRVEQGVGTRPRTLEAKPAKAAREPREPMEGRVVSLSKDGTPETFTVGPYALDAVTVTRLSAT